MQGLVYSCPGNPSGATETWSWVLALTRDEETVFLLGLLRWSNVILELLLVVLSPLGMVKPIQRKVEEETWRKMAS